jgi:hypothetical protein
MPPTDPAACPVCHRRHAGARHKDPDDRTVNLSLTIPRRLAHLLDRTAPRGERSAYVTRLLEDDLEADP